MIPSPSGAPTPADLLEGTPYRFVRALGAGGMGQVVEAEREGGGERVVIKLLHAHLAGRRDLADRLRLEGEGLRAVRHPNVVTVLDSGVTADDRPYLVMERLEGRTLRAELDARGPLPALEAIDLVAQALDGLAAVHRAGLLHRDVKLENLFVCNAVIGGARVLKLLDLGVAKRLDGALPAPLAVPTAEGVSLGTPRFFSPEQATGAPLDARADVYAAGLVLFALLTGRTPFDHHRDVKALLRAHAAEPPDPPSKHAPAPLPEGLDHAVLQALAKHPDDRPASAAAFATILRAVAERSAAPAPWSYARVLTATLLASFAISALVTAIVHAIRR
ncbi:Serine/threonine protein kinase [Minicystis rosea]|nr:Serine/threonine protein kinase [Minicystis rosea]